LIILKITQIIIKKYLEIIFFKMNKKNRGLKKREGWGNWKTKGARMKSFNICLDVNSQAPLYRSSNNC
jgi:hypothetical protein